MSACLPVYSLSVCPPVRPSVAASVWPPASLPVCLPTCLPVSVLVLAMVNHYPAGMLPLIHWHTSFMCLMSQGSAPAGVRVALAGKISHNS